MDLTIRERFLRTMHFEKVDRSIFCEWLGFWEETEHRWYREGLPISMYVEDYFGFDDGLTPSHRRLLFSADSRLYPGPARDLIPIDWGPIPRFVAKTLEENDRYRIEVDSIGIVSKVIKSKSTSTTPSWIDFPVKDRKSLQEMKKRLDPKDPRRYPLDWGSELVKYCDMIDHPVGIRVNGFFGQAFHFVGIERLLISFHKDPEFVKEIMEFWTDFLIELLKPAVKKLRIDYIQLLEDMAYKNGPMISPRVFREFMLPCYKRFTGFLRKNGIDIILVDSDGDVRPLLPLFLKGGVTTVYPLEVQANMDMLALREEYGRRLPLIGGVDKRALVRGEKAIDEEFLKVEQLLSDGGYIPCLDHVVPPDISFEKYSYYIVQLKNKLGIGIHF